MKIIAGLFFELDGVTQGAVKHRVHAVEQIAGPARTRFQHHNFDLGETLKQAVLKHRRKGLERSLRAVHIIVPQRPFLHILKALVHPLGGRLTARVNADRDVQFLGLGPERVVVRVGVGFIGWRKRHEERAFGSGAYRPFQFLGRHIPISH